MFGLAIHGGAGTLPRAEMGATAEQNYRAGLEEAIEAGGTGFARIRVGALGGDGEDRLAQHALSIRCLQRSDGSLAEPADDEADLTAVVGRSY